MRAEIHLHDVRYGGPQSQLVNVRYGRDWHDYLVCTLQYIVVTVDGRGTDFKGRQLRNPVRNQLGVLETRDQINAARCRDIPSSRKAGLFMSFL